MDRRRSLPQSVTLMTDPDPQLNQDQAHERVFLVVVDDSPELAVALRFACRLAKHTGGRVALLRVLEPADFQHWTSVGDLMRAEARTEAEQLLQKLAAQVHDTTGQTPVIYVREGDPRQALFDLIDEVPSISVLVLAAASGADPGPIINHLTKRSFSKLRVPVTIVPGNLRVEEIDALS